MVHSVYVHTYLSSAMTPVSILGKRNGGGGGVVCKSIFPSSYLGHSWVNIRFNQENLHSPRAKASAMTAKLSAEVCTR